MRLGSIEAGGTKFVVGLGNERGEILDRLVVPTTAPGETVGAVADYLRREGVDALGIGSFGPLDLDPASQEYGSITTTPKPGWADYPLFRELVSWLGVPAAIDTDVNAAALGEHAWGVGRGLSSVLYMTVGTGIGVGAVLSGIPLHGMTHPEAGHVTVRRVHGDAFRGSCPYHGDCLEGLASGTAIAARFGAKASELPDEDPFWEIEALYLAQALVDYLLVLSPEIMILGGGVMKRSRLLALVRTEFARLSAGYVRHRRLEDLDAYIVHPGLHEHSGLVGGFALAAEALRKSGRKA